MKAKFIIIKNIFVSKTNNYKICLCKLITNNSDMELKKGDTFTLCGDIVGLYLNQEYELDLTQTSHPKYGVQYTLTSTIENSSKIANANIELTPEQNLLVLEEIGENQFLTKAIHKAYPNFVELVIKGKEKEIDYKNKIKGMGKARFDLYVSKIKTRQTILMTQALFKDYNITYNEAKILSDNYYDYKEIESELSTHPYRVLIKLNRKWQDIDQLLLRLNPQLKHSDQRCEGLMYILCKQNENNGSTRILGNILAQYVNSVETQLVPNMKRIAIESPLLHYDEEHKTISILNTYKQELKIAENIADRILNPKDFHINWEKFINTNEISLTDEQAKMLEIVATKSVGLLVGSGGTGKSSSINNIVSMLKANHLTCVLLAPTGIASKRLSEVTQSPAQTIHRAYVSGNTIDADVCIVDEISMCGVEHISMLCNMLNEETKLFFVGDNAQLASIGYGNILEDLLSIEKLPKTTLTKVFRYGKGSIDTIATDVRNGKPYIENGSLIYEGHNSTEKDGVLISGDNQYEFIPLSNNPIEQIINSYKKLLTKYSKDDIFILSPYNIGDCGTVAINTAIQKEFNKTTKQDEIILDNGVKIKINDRIINKQNNYNVMSYEEYITGELSEDSNCIYNGSIGIVRNINKQDGSLIGEFEDSGVLVLHKQLVDKCKLAYAISIHSIQGNQRKAIIVLTSPQHSNMLTNNLLYVALTRASEKIIHIGNEHAINNALNIHETKNRETNLRDNILKLIGGE